MPFNSVAAKRRSGCQPVNSAYFALLHAVQRAASAVPGQQHLQTVTIRAVKQGFLSWRVRSFVQAHCVMFL